MDQPCSLLYCKLHMPQAGLTMLWHRSQTALRLVQRVRTCTQT